MRALLLITSKADKLPLEKELVARDNMILTLKTADQTWSCLTQLIIVVYYTAVDRYTTDSRPIFHRQSMVNVSAECRALYRPKYWPTVGRYIDRHSADMSVNISTDISTDISRSIYRSSVGQYVDRHIGRVSVDMSTNISVECRSIYRLIHWSTGAQNTHDPVFFQRSPGYWDSYRGL